MNLECDMVGKYVARAVELFGSGRLTLHRSRTRYRRRRKSQKIRIAKGARKRTPFASIEDAIDAIRAGRMIIVVDDEDRENEGDLTMAAQKVTPEAINFMAKHGRGLICLSMTAQRLDELEIPLMVDKNTTPFDTAFCVSIDGEARRQHRHLGRAIARRPCWRRSTRRRGRRIWRGPVTCSRCAPATAA